mgnify:FL=1
MTLIPVVRRIILRFQRKFFHVISNSYDKEKHGHPAWQYSGKCRYSIHPEDITVERISEAKPVKQQEKRSVKSDLKEQMDSSWRHFSFICSMELVDKVQAIVYKEGFTIRAFLEFVMKQGIEAYEAKHGKARKVKSKNINDVM